MSGDPDDDERLEASFWYWGSDLLERAGLVDVEPASGQTRVDHGTASLSVVSISRGRISLGTIEVAEIEKVGASLNDIQIAAYREHVRDAKAWAFDVIRPYAEQLEARGRAPLEGKAKAKEAKITRASELHEAGKSPARIAQIMTAEGLIIGDKDPGRSVRRWLSDARSRTDRKRSDSR